jgi:hypothetical protein
MNETWRPMSEAKRDGTPYLLKFKAVLPNQGIGVFDITAARKLGFKDTIIAVMMNYGQSSGWLFAARIGHGGFPDDWFEGFKELPE